MIIRNDPRARDFDRRPFEGGAAHRAMLRDRDAATRRFRELDREYTGLLRHIAVVSGYEINRDKNLWIDPYYVREMRRLERLTALLRRLLATWEG